ncbi:metallophosphoesterase family protein [Plebeiibacterium sediminum]|uniref:Metallophosphatase family protein n=1 Tax=Plebeiibacterium sediminum TaxID=2992112 RepID=A0AAE3SFD3_9BACT|nr:metallophosphoesterase family protein [Plebeiobacterium sediminum]MCW3786063.1 metallophosphatase family protein [Plebeiobacterium sediminum]
MKRIGLLSDTHSFFDPKFKELFAACDEIWHAGDIGDIKVLDALKDFKPTRAVYGNIDDAVIRRCLNEHERFVCEGVDVWITHIGGYPGKYDRRVKNELFRNPPKLFIDGHSHILKVIYDDQLNLLHINPGAAGLSGFHAVRTAIRFVLDKGEIKDLEVIELENKSFGK